jgi:DNA-directed RNA polymerase specialized sigma24 family protein
MYIDEDVYLEHYGTPRKSGRYPWGSGGNVKNSRTFLDMVEKLRKEDKFTEAEIAKSFEMSVADLRAFKTIAKNERQQERIKTAEYLKYTKQMSDKAASEQMGIPESTFRTLLAPAAKMKNDVIETVTNILRDQVNKVDWLDVGIGTEMYLNVSEERLKVALSMLKAEGYEVHSNVPVPQLGTVYDTKLRVLAKPGTSWGDAVKNRNKIRMLNERLDDTGKSTLGILPPISINPKRIDVVYGPDGGSALDGVMYIRPGVKDLDLGGSRYAQVRIKVGPEHYLKGMAMYKDDLPAGVDIQFNTNKERTNNKLDALKKLTDDPDNPFGAVIRRQITEKDPKTGLEVNKSAVNIVNEEGNWGAWSKSIASQVLSKQEPKLIRERLDTTYKQRQAELDEIMALTNPTVKSKLLQEFADGTDAASVHLKAASLPGQAWYAILPINSLSPTEVYAPNYDNGTKVSLIRYPHGGTFEIPLLVVNNKNREANKLLKGAKDAVAINAQVAERLSGADFDGDTVLVIPNDKGRIRSTPALEGLKNFNPRETYREYPGMKIMGDTQKQMGVISNLITDMTLHGASETELAAAVRHSMVVIDAEKHRLNYKQSEKDNRIRALQEKYQRKADGSGGASTIISRAGRDIRVPEVIPRRARNGGPIDRKTGELVWEPTGRVNSKTGELSLRKFEELELAKDAHDLSSGTPVERLYANHSNRLKAMANKARLEMINTPGAISSPSAKKVYEKEVSSLDVKLRIAKENAPRERRAQILANEIMEQKKQANPHMDRASEKKLNGQALTEARNRVGAKKEKIVIEPKEWEAIQAGAVSDTKLRSILDNSDMDKVRELATPRAKLLMTDAKTKQAQALLSTGDYTRAEVAARLGVSTSTLDRSLQGG